MKWPDHASSAAMAMAPTGNRGTLVVSLDGGGEVIAVELDGEPLWPCWFKLEWKGDGNVSAKVGGARLSTRHGDSIVVRLMP